MGNVFFNGDDGVIFRPDDELVYFKVAGTIEYLTGYTVEVGIYNSSYNKLTLLNDNIVVHDRTQLVPGAYEGTTSTLGISLTNFDRYLDDYTYYSTISEFHTNVKIDNTHYLLAYLSGSTPESSELLTFSTDTTGGTITNIDSLQGLDFITDLHKIDNNNYAGLSSKYYKDYSVDGLYDNITLQTSLSVDPTSGFLKSSQFNSTHFFTAYNDDSIHRTKYNTVVYNSLTASTINTYIDNTGSVLTNCNCVLVLNDNITISASIYTSGVGNYWNLNLFSIDVSYNITHQTDESLVIDRVDMTYSHLEESYLVKIDDDNFLFVDSSRYDLSGTTYRYNTFRLFKVDGYNMTEVDRYDDSIWFSKTFPLATIKDVISLGDNNYLYLRSGETTTQIVEKWNILKITP